MLRSDEWVMLHAATGALCSCHVECTVNRRFQLSLERAVQYCLPFFGDMIVHSLEIPHWDRLPYQLLAASGGCCLACQCCIVPGRTLGAELCKRLSEDDKQNTIVFGLVRGGLPVAEPVAVALKAPLDAFVSRKLGAPHQPE